MTKWRSAMNKNMRSDTVLGENEDEALPGNNNKTYLFM